MTLNKENKMDFFDGNPENANFNQYWYSKKTIERIIEELTELGSDKAIAFLSTPSLYFSLPEKARKICRVFDFDKKWSSDAGYVYYDYNDPDNVAPELLGAFDVVVIDPPFITRDVWEKYSITAKLLMKSGVDEFGTPLGKVIGTTVIENKDFLQELLEIQPTAFLPSIPNLVYQYNLYTNYKSKIFSVKNSEIPE